MDEHFEDRNEELELINKFENMVKDNDTVFFDLSEFELIIDHYTTNLNYTKALAACNAALAQYPFSTELLIDKSQLLAMGGNFEEALQLIEEVAQVDPDNDDIYVTRGEIYTQKGDYNTAIDVFKKAAEATTDTDEHY